MTVEDITRKLYDFLAGQPDATRLPSGRELSRLWQVDFSTLNRAIGLLVARGVLRREGYKLYVAQAPARTIAHPSTIHVLGDNAQFIAGAAEIASAFGSRVASSPWSWVSYRSRVRQLLQDGCQGLIVQIHPLNPIDDFFRAFSSAGVPVVTLMGRALHAHSVEMDEESAGRQAVAHLVSQGHKELACWSSDEDSERCAEGYVKACQEYGLGSSVHRTARFRFSEPPLRKAFLDLQSGPVPISALFLTNTRLARIFLSLAASLITIPRDLSVIAHGLPEDAGDKAPLLTMAERDARSMGRHAAALLFGSSSALASGIIRPPEHVSIEPKLVIRGSTAPFSPEHHRLHLAHEQALPSSREEFVITRDAQFPRMPAHPYRIARALRSHRFCPLDLRPHAKQSLTRFKGWLGKDPLFLEDTGRQKIHGIPFDLPEGKPRALVLRSKHVHNAGAPLSTQIPIHRHAMALYFLHGCGWITDHTPFAEYQLTFEDGSQATQPLIPYGAGPFDAALADTWRQESTIQDWWPSFSQFSNSRARPYLITKQGDVERYERYLYTLEWINPHPEKKILTLSVSSLSQAQATLGILAITLLLPSPKKKPGEN